MFILHHNRTESLKSLFVLSQPQSTQAHLLRQAGLKYVIYDKCFLQKCKYLMTIISREARTACCNVFYQMRAEKSLKHSASDSGEESRAECGVKTVVLSHMNAYRHTYRQASLTSKNSQETCSLNVSDGVTVHTFYFFYFFNSMNVSKSKLTFLLMLKCFWNTKKENAWRKMNPVTHLIILSYLG